MAFAEPKKKKARLEKTNAGKDISSKLKKNQ